MIELAEEEIAEAVGFQTLIIITARQRSIGQKLKLIKGEIAKLPAQMQQALGSVGPAGPALLMNSD